MRHRPKYRRILWACRLDCLYKRFLRMYCIPFFVPSRLSAVSKLSPSSTAPLARCVANGFTEVDVKTMVALECGVVGVNMIPSIAEHPNFCHCDFSVHKILKCYTIGRWYGLITWPDSSTQLLPLNEHGEVTMTASIRTFCRCTQVLPKMASDGDGAEHCTGYKLHHSVHWARSTVQDTSLETLCLQLLWSSCNVETMTFSSPSSH